MNVITDGSTIDLSARDSAGQDAFRSAMRQLAGGVSIIAAGSGLHRAGIVVSSLTSFSVEPPTVLVAIANASSIAPALRRYGHFSANILRASQEPLAKRFSGQTGINGVERFEEGNWTTLVSGAPVLVDALASLDCEIEDSIERHTHSILIGRVVAVRADENGDALGHWRRAFFSIGQSGEFTP